MNQVMSDLVVVVTGDTTYYYMKIGENLRSITMVHDSLPVAQQLGGEPIYTCHTWAKDTV